MQTIANLSATCSQRAQPHPRRSGNHHRMPKTHCRAIRIPVQKVSPPSHPIQKPETFGSRFPFAKLMEPNTLPASTVPRVDPVLPGKLENATPFRYSARL